MAQLSELINTEDPGIDHIRRWIADATNSCEVLPASGGRDEALLMTQVTTRSTMGAIVYETGGILVDGGWLRFLGSGHDRLKRTLPGWNEGRSSGFYLVADDAVGGFFAINGGRFGDDRGTVYYWPPDSLDWQSLGLDFTQFFVWSLSEGLAKFYSDLRWDSWREDSAALSPDRCFNFFPFLWTSQGSVASSSRRDIPVTETFDLKVDICSQLSRGSIE
jgi:uncharacterized protein DUF2625